MIKFKKVMTLLVIIMHYCMFYGQNGMPKIIPPTPEASNFLKYDFYPTDNTSGAMNMQIPIYTITSKGMELPITLSYHTSGIKVNDIASEAGLGWVINASGFVSVTHKGLSANNGGSAIRADWLNSQQISGLANNNNTYNRNIAEHFRFLENNNWPTEASTYNYHAPGLSGGYMCKEASNGTRTILNVPKSTDKIIDSNLGPSIINENGVKYVFNKNESVNYSNLWHLTKMINPSTKDSITFEYGITSNETDYAHEGSTITITTGRSYCSTTTGKSDFIRKTDRQIPLLTKINFNSGYISFIYSNDRIDKRRYRLIKIEIYNKTNALIKEVELHQTYFGTGQPRADYQKNVNFRLKLDSITYKDKNRERVNAYQFYYNTQYNLPQYYDYNTLGGSILDNRSHYSQDLWGYFNGKSNESFFSIESYFNTSITDLSATSESFSQYSNYLSNRSINSNYAKAAVLIGVRYPTGGMTNFEYESNFDEDGNLFGGLRIKKIKQSTGSQVLSKEFKYLSPHTNRFYTPRGGSLYDVFFNCVYTTPPDYNPGIRSAKIATMTSFGSQDDLLISGNPVFYSKVEEYQGTLLDNVGKISYEYEYEPDITTGINRMSEIDHPKKLYNFTDMSWKRGQEKKVTFFKKDSSGFTPIKSIENFYNTFLEETIFTGLDFYKTTIPANNENEALWSYGDILISIGFKKLIGTIEKEIISENVETIKSITYHYDNLNHMQVTRSEVLQSNGLKNNTVSKYPDDITSVSSLGSDNLTSLEKAAIDKLKFNEQHRISEVIQTQSYNDLNSNGSMDPGEILNTQRINYKDWSNNQVLPEFVQTSKGDGTLEDRIQYHSYYPDGKVREVSKDNGIRVVYIYGYKNEYPIAMIENATYAQVTSYLANIQSKSDLDNDNCLDSQTCNEKNLRVALNSLRADATYKDEWLVYSYTYNPLVGVTSMTDPKGNILYYEYDDFNRLKKVTDQDGKILSANEYNYKLE